VDECRFKLTKCNYCGGKGHIKPACRKYKNDNKNSNKNNAARQNVQNVQVAYLPGELMFDTVNWALNNPVQINKVDFVGTFEIPKLSCVSVAINQVSVNMEIDSGSGVSLIVRQLCDGYFSAIPLNDSSMVLTAWNSSNQPVVGQINVTAELCGRSAQLPLKMMAANRPSLFGRQWFAPLGIQPPTVAANVYQQAESDQHATELPPLEQLPTSAEPPADIAKLGTHLFESSLGCYTGPSVHMHMRADAVPHFRRARPVALANRQKATQAVESLEGTVLRPASHSEWASPAVYVVKPNGEVRFCIDYSSIITAHCNRDVYPLPSVDEIYHIFQFPIFSRNWTRKMRFCSS
jgi:hypothetical protein